MRKYIFAIASLLAFIAACTSQDDIYKDFVVKGGRVYPAKPVNVETISGYQRVTIKWEKPKDPAVAMSRLFWNNKADSVDVAYSAEGKASYTVTGLEDRSYVFYIVNFDKNGNRSLDVEVTANPYGSNWLISHSERSVNGYCRGDSAVLVFSRATYEMVQTRVAYVNTSGKLVEYPTPLPANQDTIVLYDAMKGKKVYFKSSFKPEGGDDVVENTSWTKSAHGLLYNLDVSNWTVKATEYQVQGAYTPNKIFDGLTESAGGRYVSNAADGYKEVFPKILSIDTHSEAGMEPTVFEMSFYQNPVDDSYRFIKDLALYIGNTEYDPDAGESYASTYGGFVFKRTFSTTRVCQTVSFNATGRYMAIVFINSNNLAAYFVDLWEAVPFGYIEGDSDVPYPDFK